MATEEFEETTFDDVAMILLFFFLVLIFFVFAKKYTDVELQEASAPPPPPPTKRIKTYRETDAMIWVGPDQSIHLRNLGGADGLVFDPQDIVARAVEGADWLSTEEEATSYALTEVLADYYDLAASRIGGARGGSSRKIAFYVASHAEGRYGVIHQITRALSRLKKHTRQTKGPLVVDARPCPALNDGLELAEQHHAYNACVNRVCRPGDNPCLTNPAHMATCEAATGVQRNDIKKRTCRWVITGGGATAP